MIALSAWIWHGRAKNVAADMIVRPEVEADAIAGAAGVTKCRRRDDL